LIDAQRKGPMLGALFFGYIHVSFATVAI